MKAIFIVYSLLFSATIVSCGSGKTNTNHLVKKQLADEQTITKQLTTLHTLLKDSALAVSIAAAQEAAYYTAEGKAVPAFIEDKEAVIKKSFKEEKIATNVAGFYALECGIGVLVEQKGQTPLHWLRQIVNKKLDSSEVLLLNRFANATWKAGQPFRSLQRITRSNFTVADFLSADEVKKDADQITAAAIKLLEALKGVDEQSAREQFKKISLLMKDKIFALQMAQHMEAAYYTALKKPVPAFVTTQDDTAIQIKSAFEEKVAVNLAGFYALECGLSYFAATQNKLPSAVLQSIADGSIEKNDKQLLERFANATWKAGQPFRGLHRIAKDNFTPFCFLSPAEIEKDWVQITTVAKQLIPLLQ